MSTGGGLPRGPRAPGAALVALAVVALALVALSVAVVTRWGVLVRVDHAVAAEAFHLSAARPWLSRPALVVQAVFTTGPVTLATVVAAVLLVLARHRREALLVVAAMVLTAVLTTVAKVVVDRPRPHWQHPLSTLGSASFPSGHSSSVAAGAVLAVLVTRALTTRSRPRRLVAAGAVVVALVVGADRVLLGVHYPSDVAAGYLLGALVPLVLLGLRPGPTRHSGLEPHHEGAGR